MSRCRPLGFVPAAEQAEVLTAVLAGIADGDAVADSDLFGSDEDVFDEQPQHPPPLVDAGGGGSPVLANLFMNYAFDSWLEREFPNVEFERFADEAVVHCVTERQAREVWVALSERLESVGLVRGWNGALMTAGSGARPGLSLARQPPSNSCIGCQNAYRRTGRRGGSAEVYS